MTDLLSCIYFCVGILLTSRGKYRTICSHGYMFCFFTLSDLSMFVLDISKCRHLVKMTKFQALFKSLKWLGIM
jgi:hypothetical protein